MVSEYVTLSQVGVQLKGKCPFCQYPSFIISRPKQIYKCFKCNKGGGVISFVQEIEKKTFQAAVRILADKLGLLIPE